MSNAPLTPETFDALRRLDACTLADAIEHFHERLRNEGFADSRLRCLFPELEPMLGYAATVKIRGSQPPTAADPFPDRTDWWDYIETLPAPRVVVIQDISTHPGLGSLLGAVHVNILRALRASGAITNGSVRDLPEARNLGFPLFANGVAVSHSYVHIVDFGSPVEVAGLKVNSGDLIHGDLHGVQSIPLGIAPQIPAQASKIKEEERALIALCRSPEFSLEKLRAAVNRQ